MSPNPFDDKLKSMLVSSIPPELHKIIVERCSKYNVEPVFTPVGLVIVCPKIPKKDIQRNITEGFPSEFPVKFYEGPRAQTIEAIRVTLNGIESPVTVMTEVVKRNIVIKLNGTGPGTEKESPVWAAVINIIRKDKFFEGYEIHTNDNLLFKNNFKLSEEIAKNKEISEMPVGEDDIMNLKIELGRANTIDEFLAAI